MWQDKNKLVLLVRTLARAALGQFTTVTDKSTIDKYFKQVQL
jgi:hypothetical protein